jgi:mannose-6-phosphate isomerase-like protein (cupin superfamily)
VNAAVTTEKPASIRLSDKLALISDHWNPRIIANYNGNEVRLVKVEGAFTWHSHTETDELFLVLEGELKIEFREGVATLGQGEMIVVPRGVAHRPSALKECSILILDREGEPNTGANPSSMTRARLDTL